MTLALLRRSVVPPPPPLPPWLALGGADLQTEETAAAAAAASTKDTSESVEREDGVREEDGESRVALAPPPDFNAAEGTGLVLYTSTCNGEVVEMMVKCIINMHKYCCI